MAIEVELPDGSIAEFPDGTAPDVIRSALQRQFGVGGAPRPSTTQITKPISGGASAQQVSGEFDPITSGRDGVTAGLQRLLLGNLITSPQQLRAQVEQVQREGPKYDQAKRLGANVLSLLSNSEADQELAAKAAVPGVKIVDDDRYGKVAILPDGTRQALNMPGPVPTLRDFEAFGAQALPFAATGGVGGAGATLGARALLGAGRGALGGVIRETVEAPLRTAAGGENSALEAGKDITIDALAGGAGEAVLGPLLQIGAKGVRKLMGLDQWSRESVAKALAGEGLPPETIDAVWRAGAAGQDPKALLRLVESRQTNVPLTPGQTLGDKEMMAQLRSLLGQQGDQSGGGAMARQVLDEQDLALASEAQRIRDAAGVDPTRTGAAGGSGVLAPLDARVASERARTQAAYAAIPEDTVLNTRVFNTREFSPEGRSVVDSIGDILRTNRGGAPATTGQLKRLLDSLRSGKPMPWQEWDNTRRRISELTTAEAGEGAAARQTLDLMNRMEEFASQTGNFYSAAATNPGTLIRDARRAAKTGFELFDGTVPTPTGGETPDIVSRLVSGGLQPQQVMDDILGAGGRLDPKRRGFTEGLNRLAQVSPESFQSVRLEAINRAVEQVMSAPSDKALSKVLAALRENKKFLAPLIDKRQFDEILRLGRVRGAAIAERSGSKAPLPSKDFISKLSTALLYGGGAGAGVGSMVGVGPMFGLALAGGGALGRAYANRANRKLAQSLTQPLSDLPTPAVQGVDARLFPPTFLQYLNQDE